MSEVTSSHRPSWRSCLIIGAANTNSKKWAAQENPPGQRGGRKILSLKARKKKNKDKLPTLLGSVRQECGESIGQGGPYGQEWE